MKKIAINFIKLYRRYISPVTPGTCRYDPTCSVYFIRALDRYGFLKGTFIGIKRLLRCHALHPGGSDPLK